MTVTNNKADKEKLSGREFDGHFPGTRIELAYIPRSVPKSIYYILL